MPMVIIITEINEEFRAGRMNKRSVRIPIKQTETAVSIKEGKTGKEQCSAKVYISIPPSITNSPCAKLIMSVVLYITVNPRAISAYIAPKVRPLIIYWNNISDTYKY